MRYILLIVSLAIIYIVIAKSSSIGPTKSAIKESMEASNIQTTTGASATPASDSLKAPLDRTREVLNQVRKQKAEDQF